MYHQASAAAIPAVANYDAACGQRKQGMDRASGFPSVVPWLAGAKRAGAAFIVHCPCWDSKMRSKITNATPNMQQKNMYKNASLQGESCKGAVLALLSPPLVLGTNRERCCVRCGFPTACSFHALQRHLQRMGKFGCF